MKSFPSLPFGLASTSSWTTKHTNMKLFLLLSLMIVIQAAENDCGLHQYEFSFFIATDNNGRDDNHFKVFQRNEEVNIFDKIVYKRSKRKVKSNTTHMFKQCLPKDGCYKVTVYDDGGDGICCEEGQGYFKAVWNGE